MLLLIVAFSGFGVSAQTKLSGRDFKPLKGEWKGNLEYLDYSSGKTTRIKAQARINLKKDNGFELIFIYPDEPDHNDTSIYMLNNEGSRINDIAIIERMETTEGRLKFVLEEKGRDGNDNRPATFHRVFEFSKKEFFLTKLVRREGEASFMQRHRYSFLR